MKPAVILIKYLAACVTIVAIFAATLSTPAFAIKGDSKRFAICQQLKSTNSVKWYGIASGTVDDAFAFPDNWLTFHTKACFSTQSACRTWIKRIWWEIPTMDSLRSAYCKPV